MNPVRDVWTDPDLAALVRDDPELVAIADALAETRPAPPVRRRRPRPSRLAGLAVAAAIAAVVGLAAPWNRASSSLTEKALAALGSDPVLHVVVVSTETNLRLVDLQTGDSKPVLSQTDIWYDADRQLERTTRNLGGGAVDILRTAHGIYTSRGSSPFCLPTRPNCDTAPHINPALADFVTGYAKALADGQARAAASGILDGDPVDWLVITDGGGTEKVALDQTTHKPVLIEAATGGELRRVETIETSTYDPSDFARPTPATNLPSGYMADATPGKTLPLTGAGITGARPHADWAGEALDGLPLKRAELLSLSVTLKGGSPRKGIGVEVDYGAIVAAGLPDRSRPFVEIQEDPSEQLTTALGWDVLTPFGASPPSRRPQGADLRESGPVPGRLHDRQRQLHHDPRIQREPPHRRRARLPRHRRQLSEDRGLVGPRYCCGA